jgi:transposase-like protein
MKTGKIKKIVVNLREEDCVEILEKARWKDGVFCPYCKSKEYVKNGRDDSCGVKLQRYMCKRCGKTFDVKTKTIFENSKIPLKKWFIAIALLGEVSIQFLSELLGIAYSSAYRMVKKLLSVISAEEEKRTFYGDIKLEIDETYLSSGSKGNRNLTRAPRKRGLKAGRGRGTFEKDKPAIVTFVNRDTKETMFFVPEHLSGDDILDNVGRHTEKGSKVTAYTDEHKMYLKLESAGYQHKVVNHSIEYVNGDAHINNCENRHSLLKRFLIIRRGVSKHNLQFYVRFFQFFFNVRLKSHDPIDLVLQVIHVIINFLRFLRYLKNQQFLRGFDIIFRVSHY